MMEPKEIIQIRWHVNREADPPEYQLVCINSDSPIAAQPVSLSSADVSERVARARLIEMMFKKAHELGVDPTCLRFTVNGIEE